VNVLPGRVCVSDLFCHVSVPQRLAQCLRLLYGFLYLLLVGGVETTSDNMATTTQLTPTTLQYNNHNTLLSRQLFAWLCCALDGCLVKSS